LTIPQRSSSVRNATVCRADIASAVEQGCGHE
jgi:hypothetical protein